MSTDRTPSSPSWDMGRFLKTWSYFGSVPFLSQLDWFQQMFDSRATIPLPPQGASSSTVLLIGPSFQHPTLVEAVEHQGYALKVLADPDAEPADPRDRLLRATTVIPAPSSPQQVDRDGLLDGLVAILYGGIADPQAPELAQLLRVLQAIHRDGVSVVTTLFDFAQPDLDVRQTWGALDDVVMGGVSESGIRLVEQRATFSGTVSTANSGGFASIRTRNFDPPLDLSSHHGLVLRVRGDGQRYKLLVRSENQWDGLAYSHSFDTVADQWITVRIPFTTLIPVFRAKTVPSAGPIATHRITALQLMLSKFEYDGALNPQFRPGPFRLDVASMGAYRMGDRPQLILSSTDAVPQVQQAGFTPIVIDPTPSHPQDWVPGCLQAIRQGSTVG